MHNGIVKICLGKGYGCQRVLTPIGSALFIGDVFNEGSWSSILAQLKITVKEDDWHVENDNTCWIEVDLLTTMILEFENEN
jgi:ABC-type antimicrobial peptide transport system ATPase subunit